MTKITKQETIEGELGRFMLHQGEDPQAMYNRLKTLVNQVRNLGSEKWDDHEMVKVILMHGLDVQENIGFCGCGSQVGGIGEGRHLITEDGSGYNHTGG